MSSRVFLLIFLCRCFCFGFILDISVTDPKCPENGYRYGESCFVFHGEKLPYETARAFCHSGGGDLPNVQNNDTEFYLRQFLARMSMKYWMGISMQDNRKWSYLSNASKIVKFGPWDINLPKEENADFRCAVLHLQSHMNWQAADCSDKAFGICQYLGNKICEKRKDFLKIGLTCYEISTDILNNSNAQSFCQSHGGKIFEPKNSREMEAINSAIFKDRHWMSFTPSQISRFSNFESASWIRNHYNSTLINNGKKHSTPKNDDCKLLFSFLNETLNVSCLEMEPFICQYNAK